MDKLLRQHYLQAMDIIPWRLRAANQTLSASPSAFIYHLRVNQSQWLLVASFQQTAHHSQAAATRLITALCQAIGADAKGEYVEQLQQLPQLEHVAVLISLGEVLPAALADAPTTKQLMLPQSLNAIMDNPLLKDTVWQALCECYVT